MGDAERTCVPIEEVERASSRSTIVFVLLQLTGLAIPILAAVYFQATKKSLEEKKALLEKREQELEEWEKDLSDSDSKERSLPVIEKEEKVDPDALVRMQAELDDKAKELGNRERALDDQVKDVQAKEASLQAREKKVQDLETALDSREQEVKKQEQVFQSKQEMEKENLEKGKDDLEKRKKQLEQREEALEAKASELKDLEQKLQAASASAKDEQVLEPAKEEEEVEAEKADEDQKNQEEGPPDDGEEQERIAERKLRKKLISEELDKIIKETEETELEEPFEPEAIDALKIAARKVTYLKKFYDVMKDEFIYFPDVMTTISNYELLEEAEKYYFDEEDEFPVVYSGALRSVVLQAIADKGEDEDIDVEYMEPLSMDMDLGEVDDEELSDEKATKDSTGEKSEPKKDEDTPELSEGEMRKKMIKEELDKVIKDAEAEELEEPIEEDAVVALMKGAMKVAYLKKFYDVMKDELIYFPDVMTTISNYDLIEEAEKHYYDEEDEFPALYSGALRSVVLNALAEKGEGEDLDIEYMEPLSMDMELE